MFVQDCMSSPAATTSATAPYQEAFKLMRDRGFRRLPVVGDQGRLVGIVSERDLLYASPSPATSLTVWEMHYLLAKLHVGELMTKKVVTVSPDMPIEDAARLMVAHKIGGLPVVDDGVVVGVITETDIFRAFTGMLGNQEAGLRLTLEVPERRGVLAKLAQRIYELGGNITSVGSFDVGRPHQRGLVIKVKDVSKDQLVDALEALGDHVVDAREI